VFPVRFELNLEKEKLIELQVFKKKRAPEGENKQNKLKETEFIHLSLLKYVM
jgi:hypothetical protein